MNSSTDRILENWNIRLSDSDPQECNEHKDGNGLAILPCGFVVSISPFDGEQRKHYIFVDRPPLNENHNEEFLERVFKERVYNLICRQWKQDMSIKAIHNCIEWVGGKSVVFPEFSVVDLIYKPGYRTVVELGTGSWAVFEKIFTEKTKGFTDFPEIATVRDNFDQYAVRLLTIGKWDWDILGSRDQVEAVLKEKMKDYFDNPKAELHMLDIRHK